MDLNTKIKANSRDSTFKTTRIFQNNLIFLCSVYIKFTLVWLMSPWCDTLSNTFAKTEKNISIRTLKNTFFVLSESK